MFRYLSLYSYARTEDQVVEVFSWNNSSTQSSTFHLLNIYIVLSNQVFLPYLILFTAHFWCLNFSGIFVFLKPSFNCTLLSRSVGMLMELPVLDATWNNCVEARASQWSEQQLQTSIRERKTHGTIGDSHKLLYKYSSISSSVIRQKYILCQPPVPNLRLS